MQDLWERYQAEHLPLKAPRAQADERSIWQKIILPRFGKWKLAAIDHSDIDSLHQDITNVRDTPVRANRTIETLRKAFNLAIRWKWSEHNPASGVRLARQPRHARRYRAGVRKIVALTPSS